MRRQSEPLREPTRFPAARALRGLGAGHRDPVAFAALGGRLGSLEVRWAPAQRLLRGQQGSIENSSRRCCDLLRQRRGKRVVERALGRHQFRIRLGQWGLHSLSSCRHPAQKRTRRSRETSRRVGLRQNDGRGD